MLKAVAGGCAQLLELNLAHCRKVGGKRGAVLWLVDVEVKLLRWRGVCACLLQLLRPRCQQVVRGAMLRGIASEVASLAWGRGLVLVGWIMWLHNAGFGNVKNVAVG